ncbi:hypothetical protein FA13DRAFT_1708842 [Coprinellus micaceus]|uniref:Uncharacterized protein n=1 Tax=Coprinellus micaceus TaxID=71717 RepID=A0A4Y7TH20_COPMI|nr:hypothetical protein FA13DRAFT_1708842 [Coprinellus micaceus]
MELAFDGTQASGNRLDMFSNTWGFHVNDLRLIQAQNFHHHAHNSSGKRLANLSELLQPLDDVSHKRNRKMVPPDSACLAGTREPLFHLYMTRGNESYADDRELTKPLGTRKSRSST